VAASQPSKGNKAKLQCERVKRIIDYLLRYEEEIVEMESIQLQFDCRGKDLKATKRDTESI
jgi:hypothetical protein